MQPSQEPQTVFIVTDSDGQPVAGLEYREAAELLAFVIGGKVVECWAVIVEIDGVESVDLRTAYTEEVCDDCQRREAQEEALREYAYEHRN